MSNVASPADKDGVIGRLHRVRQLEMQRLFHSINENFVIFTSQYLGSDLDWEEDRVLRVVMTDRQGRTHIQMVEQVLAIKLQILI